MAAAVWIVGWPPQREKHGKAELASRPGFFELLDGERVLSR